MRRFIVAVTLVLAGCTSAPDEAAKPAGGQPWLDDTKAAAAAGPIGAPGSACPMPVTFEVAKSWKPKVIESTPDDKLASLVHQGSFTAVCEIDAKPAGVIGFLRVWTNTDKGVEARKALEEYVGTYKYATEPEYRDVKVGSVTGAEVTYVMAGPASDPKRERVLAVSTPKGAVMLHVGGFDTDEHEQMLPAYVLAKQTLKIS